MNQVFSLSRGAQDGKAIRGVGRAGGHGKTGHALEDRSPALLSVTLIEFASAGAAATPQRSGGLPSRRLWFLLLTEVSICAGAWTGMALLACC